MITILCNQLNSIHHNNSCTQLKNLSTHWNRETSSCIEFGREGGGGHEVRLTLTKRLEKFRGDVRHDRLHTHTHTHTHTYVCTNISTYMNTYNEYIYTYINTYVYTCKQRDRETVRIFTTGYTEHTHNTHTHTIGPSSLTTLLFIIRDKVKVRRGGGRRCRYYER